MSNNNTKPRYLYVESGVIKPLSAESQHIRDRFYIMHVINQNKDVFDKAIEDKKELYKKEGIDNYWFEVEDDGDGSISLYGVSKSVPLQH